MSKQNKIVFVVEKDGKKLELNVERPSPKVQEQAQKVQAAAFAEYLKAGAILREKLDSVLREQKVWDDERQAELEAIQKRIGDNEKVVEGRVKGVTLARAKAAAIQLRRDRGAIRNLVAEKINIESNSVQGQAENRRFNFLVSACTKYNETGKPYFASYDDYAERENDPVVGEAATKFASLYYGHDPDHDRNLPENVFLRKWKFCNDKLHLVKVVNGVEKLCDTEGRLMNEDGRYVDEAGNFVDLDGKPVDADGNPVGEETFPFVDDKGHELTDPAKPAAPEVPAEPAEQPAS